MGVEAGQGGHRFRRRSAPFGRWDPRVQGTQGDAAAFRIPVDFQAFRRRAPGVAAL